MKRAYTYKPRKLACGCSERNLAYRLRVVPSQDSVIDILREDVALALVYSTYAESSDIGCMLHCLCASWDLPQYSPILELLSSPIVVDMPCFACDSGLMPLTECAQRVERKLSVAIANYCRPLHTYTPRHCVWFWPLERSSAGHYPHGTVLVLDDVHINDGTDDWVSHSKSEFIRLFTREYRQYKYPIAKK